MTKEKGLKLINKENEIIEFETVNDFYEHLINETGKEKINKGLLYNLKNGKSKSCYGYKLYSEELMEQTKESFNLSIDKNLKKYIKHAAINEGITVSELIEDYIKAIKATNGETIKAINDINLANKLRKVKHKA